MPPSAPWGEMAFALVERCCGLARRMAERLGAVDGVEILNDVVLSQVLVRFTHPDGGDADLTGHQKEASGEI